ncbi:MAG TPA: DUF945 family protein [Cellvibrionaceae bacterium]
MKKILGIFIAVAIAFFLGMLAERKLNRAIAHLHAYPGYTAEVVAFERGWFSSQAQLSIGMDLPQEFFAAMESPAFGMSLPLAITLQQGPVFFNEGLGLGWYRWQAVPANNKTGQSEPSSPLFTHRGITSLSGHTRFTDNVSAFSKTINDENGVVDFGGYHGLGIIGSSGRMSYVGDIESFSFSEGDKAINLRSFNVKTDADLAQMDWELFVYPGEFALSLAELNAAINTGAQLQEIKLQTLTMTSSMKVPANANWMSMDLQTAIASLTVNDWYLRDLIWDMAFDNFSMDFYRAYHHANIEMFDAMYTADTDTPPALNFGKHFTPEVMQAFIENGPAFRIDTLSATLPQGEFAVSAGLNLKADTPVPALPSNPLWLIGAIQAQASIEVDQTLAQYFARLSTEFQVRAAMAESPDVTEEQIQQMLDTQVTTTLDMLIQQGLVISQGEVLTSQLQYNGGEFTVNGNPIPLGAMLGGM